MDSERDADMQRFGEKLRTLRQREGLTLKELTAQLGLSAYSHISKIENGEKKPSLELAFKISRFFGISLDSLVDDNVELDW